jgi:predicted dehydrogenase
VAAVCVRDSARGAALRDFYGIPAVYTDYCELIADPTVDVVHVCTPNDSHFEIAAAALRAGKNVISEKPLARNADEAVRLAALAAEAAVSWGAKGAVNFPYRHHAMAQVARRMIAEGALGDLHSVRGAYLQDWLLSGGAENWRLDPAKAGKSRAMADIGSHWLDLARFLTGRDILEVCADVGEYVRRPRHPGTEDGGSVLLGFSGGLRGSFSVSQASAGRKMGFWIEIDGSKASMRWDHENPYRLWIGHGDRANEELVYHPSMAMEGAEGKAERWPDPQKRMIEAFYRSVAGRSFEASGGPTPGDISGEGYATFDDGARIARIIEKILESHENRMWIPI